MSFGTIGDTTLPPVSAANEPADIRNGNSAAQKAYQEALGFEDILVQQLSQALASTVSTPTDDSSLGSDRSDGSDSSDSPSSTGGILGSDPSTSAFASLIPTALTQSIMSSGGTGIAQQLAQAIDPAIGTPQGEASNNNKTVGAQ
jgi:Rod binding domain-containing protein